MSFNSCFCSDAGQTQHNEHPYVQSIKYSRTAATPVVYLARVLHYNLSSSITFSNIPKSNLFLLIELTLDKSGRLTHAQATEPSRENIPDNPDKLDHANLSQISSSGHYKRRL